MAETMAEKHQKVLDVLLQYHKQNPEQFFFTLRQINRANRLDQGYWFHGNEVYLAVSFWSGRDWMSKTPRISFIVWESGWVGLMLSQKDTDTDIFSEELITKLNAHLSDKENVYWKDYTRFGQGYLDALERFLKEDKPLIDQLILEDKAVIPGPWMEYTNSIDFIRKEDFDKNLNRIKEYQIKRKSMLQELGYITGFSIQDYGLIDDLSISGIPRDNRWIFLTGENGAGKTTILRALAIGLTQNTDGEDPIDIDGDYNISIHLSSEKQDHVTTVTRHYFEPDTKPLVETFTAYGPVRLLTEGSLDPQLFQQDIKIHHKMTYSLFQPVGILKDLSNDYPLFVKPKYMEMSVANLLENMREIVPHFDDVGLENNELIFYQTNKEDQENPHSFPFSKLPSGTRNYVSLIVDLLIRLQRQQPDVPDMANYKGVVIIDEIDIHLHPKLQIEIIKQLSETFPKIQFIVTTHSPVVLLGAPPNSVFFTVTRDELSNNRIRLERMDDKIPVHRLLPNALLSSPLFDLDDITPLDSKIPELMTGDNFEDALLEYLLMKRYNLLKDKL